MAFLIFAAGRVGPWRAGAKTGTFQFSRFQGDCVGVKPRLPLLGQSGLPSKVAVQIFDTGDTEEHWLALLLAAIATRLVANCGRSVPAAVVPSGPIPSASRSSPRRSAAPPKGGAFMCGACLRPMPRSFVGSRPLRVRLRCLRMTALRGPRAYAPKVAARSSIYLRAS